MLIILANVVFVYLAIVSTMQTFSGLLAYDHGAHITRTMLFRICIGDSGNSSTLETSV